MLKNKWFKFAIIYIGATALSLSMLKITPIQKDLGISISEYGLLSSVFTWSAIVLGIPGGYLISKFGAKKMGIFIMACLAVGNILGSLSVNEVEVINYPLLLISRGVEGISFAMVQTIAMVFIGKWFADGSSGMAIGIFGTFSAFASMVGMNIYKPVFENFGLPAVWHFTAILCTVVLVGFFFLLDDVREDGGNSNEAQSSYAEVLRDKNTWFMAIAMFTMTFVLYSFIAFYPRIFSDLFGLSDEVSNSHTGLFGLFGVPFGLIAGFLVDHVKIKPVVLGIATGLLMGLSCVLTLFVSADFVLIQVFLLSAAISMFSSTISISVPGTVKRPALIGKTFAVIYEFYYIGVAVGQYASGKIVGGFGDNATSQGWIVSLTTMAVISGVGVLCMIMLAASKRRSKVTGS